MSLWKKRTLKVEVVGSRRYWEVSLKEESGGKDDVGRYVGKGGCWKEKTFGDFGRRLWEKTLEEKDVERKI